MNLTTITDSTLVQNIEKLVREERELLTTVLHHLREIERRRLFSTLGFKSLFDFAVRSLGYPEDQAYRRISAMRLLKEIPELEKKIERGEISLTHIGLAHKHPHLSLGELFEKLCDLGLTEWDLAKTAAPRKRRVNPQAQAQILKTVFSKAEGRCENCDSNYALEIDHIIPRAKGGTSESENLRILCRNCNQRAAIQEFGQHTMDRYLN